MKTHLGHHLRALQLGAQPALCHLPRPQRHPQLLPGLPLRGQRGGQQLQRRAPSSQGHHWVSLPFLHVGDRDPKMQSGQRGGQQLQAREVIRRVSGLASSKDRAHTAVGAFDTQRPHGTQQRRKQG